MQEQKIVPDVWMIDGAGILHPRRMGIARTFGLIVQRPTIGVTKKLLCGRIEDENPDGWRPIVDDGEIIGAAIPPWPGRRRPLYVSPGYGMSVEDAVRITREMLRGRRLPEPIYWADRLSRAAARR
jgi:deoxyribonuclease V